MARNGRKMIGAGYDKRRIPPKSSEHIQGTGKIYYSVGCDLHGMSRGTIKERYVRVPREMYATKRKRYFSGCPQCRGSA